MRVPGSRSKLALFEYDSSSEAMEKKLNDESGGSWMPTWIVQPLIMLLFCGGACYISYNSVKKKNDQKRSAMQQAFGRNKSASAGGFGRGLGGGARRRR